MYSVFWIVLMTVLAVVELMTLNFVTIWFAAGSLAALISSLTGIDFVWQMWIFIIVSVLSLIFTKPLVGL